MIALLRRRAMMILAAMEGDTGDMNIKTGEFVGNGTGTLTIEHGLGEVPLLFAFVGENPTADETSGTLGGVWMNTGIATNYTSAITKNFIDVGCKATGEDTAYIQTPTSTAYGVQTADESTIEICRYANNQNFISGKTYKWIAIADWR